MKRIEIKSRNILNNFLENEKHSQFLQSWEWGEFQENLGNKIFRIGVEKAGELLAVATLIKKSIGAQKNYFYCPRGPIVNTQHTTRNTQHTTHNTQHEIEEHIFNEIKSLAKKEKSIFLRFEPQKNIHDSLLIIHDSISLQPAKTLMLDLLKSEEDLLAEMHQKTRYNIRLAKKRGVEIIEGTKDDFDEFWKLMNKTSERDRFRIHKKEHYNKLLEINFVKIFFAKFEKENIATGIFSFYGDTVTYMHGASSNEHRNTMSPFLLQWQVIKLAKDKGYKYYDFFGIDETKWSGVTRFKKGFGGFEVSYPGTLDIAFNRMLYYAYKFLRKIRRKIK